MRKIKNSENRKRCAWIEKRTTRFRAAATQGYDVVHNLVGGRDVDYRTLGFVGSVSLEVLCTGKVVFVKAANIGQVEPARNRKGRRPTGNPDDWAG